jgi:methyl-accepting chemotaxis protein
MKSLRAKLLVGFLVPLGLLVPTALAILNAQSSARGAAGDVQSTQEVLRLANQVMRASVDSETGVRGFIITGLEPFLEPYNQGRTDFDVDAQELHQLVSGDAAAGGLVQQMITTEQDWRRNTAEPAIRTRRTAGLNAASAYELSGAGKSQKDRFRTLGEQLLEAERLRLVDQMGTSGEAADRAKLLVVLSVLGVGVAGVLVAFVISRTLSRRVRTLVKATDALRIGDQSRRVDDRGDDEVSKLSAAFNAMADRLRDTSAAEELLRNRLQQAIERSGAFAASVVAGDLDARLALGDTDLAGLEHDLNGMVAELQRFVVQVVSAAQQIAVTASDTLASADQHARAATVQSAAVAQVASTADQVRAATEQSASRAEQMARLSTDAVRGSDAGEVALQELGDGIVEIRKTMSALADDILRLAEHAQQINEIVAVVSDLADQSNLLALNASIEAAKAGEHGRGFTVVATEIRSLADQSKDATIQIRTILGEIQRSTNAAVIASEHGGRAVHAGGGHAERARRVLEHLTGSVSGASEAAQVIVVSAQEQRVGMDQVASSLRDIDSSTAQFVAGAEQLQGAARDLADLAARLDELTNRYRAGA